MLSDGPVLTDTPDAPAADVAFSQLTEEELLAGIGDLVPPEKTDDF